MLFDFNFEAKFGMLLSFRISQDPIYYEFHISVFDLILFNLTTNAGGDIIFYRKRAIQLGYCDQS